MGPIRTDDVGKVKVPPVSDNAAVDATLRFIAQRAWRSTQEEFFSALVTHLAESLGVSYAFVDKIADGAGETVETIALYANGEIVRNIEYDLVGTPCENVVGRDMCCYVDKIQQQFPTDDLLAQMGAESYAGIPLWTGEGKPLGLIAVMDTAPLSNPGLVQTLLQIVALRAGSELEHNQLESQLLESRQRFEDFAMATSDWFWEMDENLRYTWFSSNVETVTGVAPEWHYGKTRAEIGAPEEPSIPWEEHLETLRRREPFKDFVFLRRGPDGEKWLKADGIPVFDEDGTFRGYRGTGSDLTAEVQARLAADRAQTLLSSAIEALDELFVLWDPDDRMVVCNQRYREFNSIAPDALEPGISFAEHQRRLFRAGAFPEIDADDDRWLQERIARHRSPTEPVELAREDGVWMLVDEQKLPDGSTVTLAIDITARKKIEAEHAESSKVAELANHAKSHFLATMSHELRTPLNAILGFSEVLRGELFGPLGGRKYLEYASDIHTSAEHLLALVNDMLDVSAIEAGQWRLHRETVAIGELIVDCVEIMSERAARKRITLTIKISTEPLFVSLDKRAFKQILLNLLTNSVTFTLDGGSVTVTANTADGGVEVTVADTGVGIAADQLPTITESFRTGTANLQSDERGWGLGLSIADGLVKMHGGHMSIESELGVGTRIALFLPDPSGLKEVR